MKTKFILLVVFSVFICSSCRARKTQNNTINYSINELNDNLIRCIETNNYGDIEYWLSMGADANIQYMNQSLLSYCTYKNLTEASKVLINYGADVNWIDPQDHVSVFSNVIFKNNIELGKYFLEHNLDLTYKNYSGFNYFEESIFYKNDEENLFFNDYRFTYLLLDNEIMRKEVEKDEGTIYSLIRNWNTEMPSIIEKIYGSDYIFPDYPPALLIAIAENEIDAVKYLISKGIQIDKEYYEPDFQSYFLPEDFALKLYQEIVHNLGEDSIDAQKMYKIFLLLESEMNKKI